ncbi:hypothetical protein [Clostridium sp.]|uniref:hypothetical protein n=1 Tax=Clostridium sp. TaxID=1506 RepID=UPI001ED2A70E|nr:hypothetical protein [Clostridium sp.]MBS5886020.1 hypothetical protein [Clostridium sp.]
MERFLEVHDTVININDIRRVEFISDDIYLGLLPRVNGEIVVDYVDFTYAKIHTFDNREIDLEIDLYALDEGETEEEWINRNRAYINMSMTKIYELLNPVKVTEMEYNQ